MLYKAGRSGAPDLPGFAGTVSGTDRRQPTMSTRARLSHAGNASAGSRWRRGVRSAGRPLAVFAVILQLAFVFGHHHFDWLGQRALAQAFALLQTGDAAATSDDSRQGQLPVVPAHALCLVCVAVDAAASLDAGAPPLALPVAYAALRIVCPPAASLPPPRAAAFDSRGPPRA
jgi:hypothetical protein